MICDPCTSGDHEGCDDVQRQQRFLEWLGTQKSAPPKATEPTRGCPCLHRVTVATEGAA